HGGAIYNSGDLTVSNTSFDGNFSDQNKSLGGSIYSDAGTVTISNSDFTIDGASPVAKEGGAIYLAGGNLSMTDGSLTKLVAFNTGGAVRIASGATATFTGVSISDNVGQQTGGAVNNGGSCTLDGCSVARNLSDNGNGGAIYSTGTLTISDTTFSDNSA